MSSVICPHCRLDMDDVPDLAGQGVACPRCGNQFVMPGIPRATFVRQTMTHAITPTSSSRFREARGLSDMFEMNFEVYVTPLIVRVIWFLNVLFSFLLIVAAMIAVFWIPFNSSVETSYQIAMRCLGVLALLAFLFLGLLSVRLSLEVAVVFFNISLSLQSIDKKTKA